MEKEHFEILLERIDNNFQLAFEGFDGVNRRLDRLEAGQSVTNDRLDRLEAGQESLKADVRDIKRTTGLFHAIANDHQSRLQFVELTLKDHLDNHS